jgi:hypothetical protein
MSEPFEGTARQASASTTANPDCRASPAGAARRTPAPHEAASPRLADKFALLGRYTGDLLDRSTGSKTLSDSSGAGFSMGREQRAWMVG